MNASELVNERRKPLSRRPPGRDARIPAAGDLPQGSPNHTSYGSGHATVAGACVTMLKAFFDESAQSDNPVMPSADATEANKLGEVYTP